MTPFLLIAAAWTLAAPPPKPVAYTGRIALWVGDKFEHFRPDGGDVSPFALPAGVDLPQYGVAVAPDRKTAVHLDRTGSNPNAGLTKSTIVVTPLVGDGQPFRLEGYVAVRCVLSADGAKVYFSGGKGDELDADKVTGATGFAFDLVTRKVVPLALPEKHTPEAASPDGKVFLTSRIDTDNNAYSRRSFLVPAGGKPAEVYKENVFPSMLTFSPDGSKVLAQSIEYTDVRPAGNGGFQVGGVKPREYVVLDVATKTTTPLKIVPADGYLAGWAWSPDGSQMAYAWYDPRAAAAQGVAVPAPGGGMVRQREYEYKVFVADADGGNPKEVYKTKGTTFRAFMWK